MRLAGPPRAEGGAISHGIYEFKMDKVKRSVAGAGMRERLTIRSDANNWH